MFAILAEDCPQFEGGRDKETMQRPECPMFGDNEAIVDDQSQISTSKGSLKNKMLRRVEIFVRELVGSRIKTQSVLDRKYDTESTAVSSQRYIVAYRYRTKTYISSEVLAYCVPKTFQSFFLSE